MDTTFTHLHWPLPRPATLDMAKSHLHLPTGVSPSVPVHSSTLQLRMRDPMRHNLTPHLCHVAMADSVWAVPLSLAATDGISIDFSSSSYSDASLRTVRPPKPTKARECLERPHSDIPGSTVACTYPRLIAACHVLLRLSSRVIHQPASLHQFQFNFSLNLVLMIFNSLTIF